MNNKFFLKDNSLMILKKYTGTYTCFREREKERENCKKLSSWNASCTCFRICLEKFLHLLYVVKFPCPYCLTVRFKIPHSVKHCLGIWAT